MQRHYYVDMPVLYFLCHVIVGGEGGGHDISQQLTNILVVLLFFNIGEVCYDDRKSIETKTTKKCSTISGRS